MTLDELYDELTKVRAFKAQAEAMELELAEARVERDHYKRKYRDVKDAFDVLQKRHRIVTPDDDRWLAKNDATLTYRRKMEGGVLVKLRAGGRTVVLRKDDDDQTIVLGEIIDMAQAKLGA